MVVDIGPGREDLVGVAAGTVRHEHRVAWTRGVKDHLRAVMIPGHVLRRWSQKHSRLATHQRHAPYRKLVNRRMEQISEPSPENPTDRSTPCKSGTLPCVKLRKRPVPTWVRKISNGPSRSARN